MGTIRQNPFIPNNPWAWRSGACVAQASSTTELASTIIDDLCRRDPALDVDHLNVWEQTLPSMSGATLTAKYSVFAGKELSVEQKTAWDAVRACIARLCSADLWLLAVPMWNFGVPYPLKHYIDVVTQPRLTFSWTPEEGYRSLLPPRRAIVVASSAGDYSSGSGNAVHDYHLPYLIDWLQIYMGCQVDAVSLAPTIAHPDTVRAAALDANRRAAEIVASIHR